MTKPPTRLLGERVERCVLLKHPPLELLQTSGRGDAKLVVEHPPEPLEGVERLGVPTAAVQGEHELAAQALAHGVPTHECVELGDELCVAPERQLRLDALLQAGDVLLSQSRPLKPCERLLELCECLAAPELERSAEGRLGLAGVRARQRLAALRMELLEAA